MVGITREISLPLPQLDQILQKIRNILMDELNWFSHLNNFGVVVNTATLEGFLNLEPRLRNRALLYDWMVVRILAGHLVLKDE